MADEVEVLVEGGKASAGPPIGPALGPLGLNVAEVVKKINELTKDFQGMKVPVKIIVDPATKNYELKVGTPPASALIMKRANLEKGASDATAPAGNITMKDVVDIAKMKKNDLLGKDLKAKAKEIVGTCVSMGVTIEGVHPKEIIKKIEEGEFDELFKED
ncbi:MAG TPA: 50S ribosomal protein L11 [Thermoplasmatales archaeon]|nr:50S ribosomal protein L11 [Thermoplasmatales archaeon]